MRVERQAARDHHPRGARPFLLAGFIGLALGLSVGVVVTQLLGPGPMATSSLALPSLYQRWRALRARAQFPRLALDLDLPALQVLQGPAFGPSNTADPEACVLAIASMGDLIVDVTLCPHRAAASADEGAHPVFELQMDVGELRLGSDRVLFLPAGADAALVEGYYRSLTDVGIPAPAYDVVRLTVNGSRWGLYAMEALWTADRSSPDDGTPIVAFDGQLDTELFAEGLANSFAQAEIRQGYLPRHYFASAQMPGAASNSTQMLAASQSVERFRDVLNGRTAPSAVIDAERLGRVMALTALWRGCLVPDWRAVQFLYDAASGQFIPLVSSLPQNAAMPLPKQLYNDIDIQRAYVQALQVYSDAGYARTIINELELDVRYLAFSGALRRVPELAATLDQNQATMRRVLVPPQTLRARYYQDLDILHIQIEVTEPLPVVVSGLEFGAQGYLPLVEAWVASDTEIVWARDAGLVLPARVVDVPSYFTIRVPRADLPMLASSERVDLSLVTRVLGVDTRVTVGVSESPSSFTAEGR